MSTDGTVLLTTSYFGSIHYFSKFLIHPIRVIEQYDHYTKQTYRNRCNIYGANGILSLSIPVLKGARNKSHVKDIRIDYNKNWRKLHWKGIESAYRHSPFFEYYMDDVQSFLGKKHSFLIALNLEIMDYLLEALDIPGKYSLSDGFMEAGKDQFIDCRETIHPKRKFSEDPDFRTEVYSQVFSDRLGFQENLSVIDLLFNEGPNARTILEKCIRKD
ncbi:WbqC family protein [Bacteroidota bacterium]